MGTGGCIPEEKSSQCEVTTHLHLALRLRMNGAIPSLPCMPVWNAQGLLYPYLTIIKLNTFHTIATGNKENCNIYVTYNWRREISSQVSLEQGAS